jgi:hypothetical protein
MGRQFDERIKGVAGAGRERAKGTAAAGEAGLLGMETA